MTLSKYLVLRLAVYFGYSRKNVRIGDFASETMLLKEAQTFLGKAVWQKCDQIQELSTEYWNLRKLSQEHLRISQEMRRFQAEIDEIHHMRACALKDINKPVEGITKQRKELSSKIDQLNHKRDRISAKTAEAQRNLGGLKIKIEVLGKEGNKTAEIQKTKQQLEKLKAEMESIQVEKEKNAEEISAANAKLRAMDEEISAQTNLAKSKVTEAYQNIGDTNYEISTRRAELNSLNTQMRQLFMDVGRHVSRHSKSDPYCRKICAEMRGLVDVMAALQRSIYYNSRLADLS